VLWRLLDEHFLLHVVLAQSAHGIEVFRVGLFFGSDLLQTLPVPCLLTIAYLVLARRTRTDSDAFYVAFLLGTLVACLIPRIKVSGAINNLIPVYAFLCIFTGLAVSRLQALRLATESRRSVLAALLSASLVVQLIALGYDPASALPRRVDEAAGQKLLQIISGFEGEVLIPVGGYLAGLAGKQVYAHQMPVSDFAKSGLAEADPLGESYLEAIRAQRFAAIIDSNTGFLASYPDDTVLRTHYRLVGPIFRDPVTFTPRSGARIRPGSLWVPRLAD
jgi:hypothetical protein